MTDTSFRNYRYSTGGGCENCITIEGFESSELGKYGAKCPDCDKELERCGDCGRFYHIRTFVSIKFKGGWTSKCYNCGKDDPRRMAPITIDLSPYMGTISSDPEPVSIETKTVQTPFSDFCD